MKGSTYNQLTVFMTIAQEGSIRGAARKLGVAPPSVSNALKQLERHLGLPLITRTTRHMELTDAGHLLLTQTEPMMEALSYALESVSDLSGEPSGKVRLTIPRLAYELLIRPIYAEFCRTYPQIQLELSILDTVTNLIEDGYDAGIRLAHSVEEQMVSLPLTPPIAEAIFASKDYLDEFGVPESPEDLSRHRVIQFRYPTSNKLFPVTLSDQERHIEVKMEPAIIVNDSELVVDSAVQGLGIGMIFAPRVQALFDSGCLVPILKHYWRSYPGLHVYFPQQTQKAKRVRVLIDFLRARAIRSWS